MVDWHAKNFCSCCCSWFCFLLFFFFRFSEDWGTFIVSLFTLSSSAMDSLSLRLCPPAAHPATTSSRSVLSTCFVFFFFLFLQSLSARFFALGFFLFLFLLLFGGMDYCGFHLLLLSSFGIPMLHWLSGIICVCVFWVCLLWVFCVDFSVGSALAKW